MFWESPKSIECSTTEVKEKSESEKAQDSSKGHVNKKDGEPIRFLPRSLHQEANIGNTATTLNVAPVPTGPHTPEGEYNGKDDEIDVPTPTQDESQSFGSIDNFSTPLSIDGSSEVKDIYDPEAPLSSPEVNKPRSPRNNNKPVSPKCLGKSPLRTSKEVGFRFIISKAITIF